MRPNLTRFRKLGRGDQISDIVVQVLKFDEKMRDVNWTLSSACLTYNPKIAQQQCSPDKRPIFHSPRLRERATEADPPPSPAPAKRLGGGGRGSGERPFLFPEDGVWLLLQRPLQISARVSRLPPLRRCKIHPSIRWEP